VVPQGLLSLTLVLCVSCTGSSTSPAPSPTSSAGAKIGVATPLGGVIVARVGDTDLEHTLVREVMAARTIGPSEAVRLLVDECLLAEAAKKSGGADDRGVRLRTNAALARMLVERFTADARAMGPFTEEELGATVGADWVELDRPETRVAAHALIRAGAPNGAQLAEKMREKLVTSDTVDAFLADARAFPLPEKVERVVESLPEPFTIDGRLAVPDRQAGLLPEFTKGAFAVDKVGGTSAVVVTKFGWHVLRVVEIRPGYRAPYAERSKRLEGAVLRMRALERYEAKIGELRTNAKVQVLATDADLGLPRSDYPIEVRPEPPR
jgi:hypothetical protein